MADDRLPIGSDLELLIATVELVGRLQFASLSTIQRKVRVGFVKAGQLLELMEDRGIVGPAFGTHARAVLITPAQVPAVVAALRAEVTS